MLQLHSNPGNPTLQSLVFLNPNDSIQGGNQSQAWCSFALRSLPAQDALDTKRHNSRQIEKIKTNKIRTALGKALLLESGGAVGTFM